ncbi:MAG: nucleotidyltransferase [Anaerolineae bacterium]|nr:nucleotidyltransferase [Anaerolineae bacterium]
MLNQDFREFIESLNTNEVQYLVVGGYAVAFHGHPRYTKDIDIWLKVEPENAKKVIQALADFGFASLELTSDDFLTPGYVIQLGNPPYRIDLLTELQGVDFDACYSHRALANFEGLLVNFIDLENLKLNKKAVARDQDLADLKALQ